MLVEGFAPDSAAQDPHWIREVLIRQFGGAPIPLKWSWLTLVVPLVGPWALASLAIDHHVAWRGRDYALDGSAHLRS